MVEITVNTVTQVKSVTRQAGESMSLHPESAHHQPGGIEQVNRHTTTSPGTKQRRVEQYIRSNQYGSQSNKHNGTQQVEYVGRRKSAATPVAGAAEGYRQVMGQH